MALRCVWCLVFGVCVCARVCVCGSVGLGGVEWVLEVFVFLCWCLHLCFVFAFGEIS